ADGDPVAEELARSGYRSCEVDRAEHQHPRSRSEGLNEYRQLLPPPFPLWAVSPDAGEALGQHAAGVVVHRLIEPFASAQRALSARVLPDHPPGTYLARTLDDRRQRYWNVLPHRSGNLAERRE